MCSVGNQTGLGAGEACLAHEEKTNGVVTSGHSSKQEVPVRPQAGWESGDSAMVRWELLNHCRKCLFMLFPLIAIVSSGVSRPFFSMSPLASWPLRTVVGSRIFWLAFRGFYGISCVTSASLFWIVSTSSYF